MIYSTCSVVQPINKISFLIVIMPPELVTPTEMVTTRKCSRDCAYISTRKTTDIWLVGQISSSLSTTKLPSKKETGFVFPF